MDSVTTVEALLLLLLVGASVAVVAWLLSGVGLEPGGPAVRASARSGSGDGACGSDRPAPRSDAMPERPGR